MRRAALLSLTTALGALAFASSAQAADLTLSFPDLKPGGQVTIAVFRTEASWKSRGEPVWSQTVRVGASSVQIARNLPPGDYAVMAYHDRNANGKLDTLPIGVPTEPYGFSNDSRGMFGPPAWSAARFRLGTGALTQVIRLR